MALDHLQLFRDIVQTRSISRGASMNGMSQSAASQHVQELEKKLGVELLDRSTRPFILAPAGKLYYDFCRDTIRRQEQFLAALGDVRDVVDGTVRVASIYSIGLSEMSQLESEFSRRYPRASLSVEYLRPERVYEWVLNDRVDLGLVSYPEPTRELNAIPWREEEMAIAASPRHEICRRRSVKVADLNGVDFVGFDDDLPIRREVDRYLREQEVEVNITMRFDNLQMILQAVELGSGISIVPVRIIRKEVKQGRLVAIPIGRGELVRPLGIVHRRKKKFSRAAQSFLNLLQEHPQS